MNIRFFLDPETGLPHIYNHEVNEDEVEDILTLFRQIPML